MGVILLVLRRLPEATGEVKEEQKVRAAETAAPRLALLSKGLPAQAFSKSRSFLQLALHKVWQFLLEAKGLKHSPKISHNFKKITQEAPAADVKPSVIKNEKYYIELIKRNPKDNSYYDLLGQFYFESQKFDDAANVYEYLVNHVPQEAGFWAKLGFAHLQRKWFRKASEGYLKAIELDPSNPSRFYNLALSYQGMGEWKQAGSALRSALELEPQNQKYSDLLFVVDTKAKTSVPVENIHKKA